MAQGVANTVTGFFGGMVLIGLIDYLVPSYANPHDAVTAEEVEATGVDRHLKRIGILTALAIGIHNFPEGLATFAGALKDPAIGIPIAVAIAVAAPKPRARPSSCGK